jgi:hypothetical protein
MSEDQFTKLFKYMQGEFKLINQKLDGKASASDMQMILNLLDSIVKKQEI